MAWLFSGDSMERFSLKTDERIERTKIDTFLSEIHEVCKKHGMCIKHEDGHGGFIIERYDGPESFAWLNNAMIGKTAEEI